MKDTGDEDLEDLDVKSNGFMSVKRIQLAQS